MERLTVDTNISFCDIAQCKEIPDGPHCPSGSCDQRRVYERLREYERAGLSPREIDMLQDMDKRAKMANLLRLEDYQAIGPVSEFRALKEAKRKRQEGCERCKRESCDTCFRFGWHPDICQKCENQSHYSAKPFCSHCGRDLRGESHND